eukprot:6073947-Prymnesium_polylepis.1
MLWGDGVGGEGAVQGERCAVAFAWRGARTAARAPFVVGARFSRCGTLSTHAFCARSCRAASSEPQGAGQRRRQVECADRGPRARRPDCLPRAQGTGARRAGHALRRVVQAAVGAGGDGRRWRPDEAPQRLQLQRRDAAARQLVPLRVSAEGGHT